MSLRRALRSGVAAACIVGVAAPAITSGAPAMAQSAQPLTVSMGQGRDFSRVEFRWSGGARMTSRREGQTLIVAFNRDARPNIAELRAMPPRWVAKTETRHTGGRLEVVFTLAQGADARAGTADGVSFVNFFKAAEPGQTPAGPATETASAPARANPVPASGVVRVAGEASEAGLALSFDFAAPAGSAVFRRGEAIWIVFDAAARLDLSGVAARGAGYSKIEALRGADYSALRIVAPPSTLASVQAQGNRWHVRLGARADGRFDAISLKRDEVSNPPALTAVTPGATRALWIQDPAVGDRLAVVTALGPAKGMAARRAYVDMTVLPSTHGLATEVRTSDLVLDVQGDLVRIGRPSGLALSPVSAQTMADAQGAGDLAPAPMPGLVSPSWTKTSSAGFLAQHDALMAAAAAEGANSTPGAPVSTKARMQLARFLVGHELAFEAIGVLNAAARAEQTLMGDAEFRGLRGAARMMAGRYREAEADLSVPVLADDPASSLWRSLIAAKAGQWEDARVKHAQGQRAMAEFSPLWRARFARADAEAAVALGDYASAAASIAVAVDQPVSPEEQLEIRLTQAEMFRAMGDTKRAQAMFEAIARAPVEKVAAPALLQASQLKLDSGQINPNKAAEIYSQVRFRWRGDATELETIRALGQLYMGQGRYREGLEALRSAGQRLPDLPEAVALQNDLHAAFRDLFLGGAADGLQPIQALALFYDFKDMTPIGVEGDQMVRNLVRRLVDVDLLDQAAELLKYQVDNRLDGIPKAQVATDLATIYLMARKPEAALQTINDSRSTLLPNALNAERRLVTARALAGLGRLDAAAEFIETDKSREAQDIRAELAWKGRSWPQAGSLYEAALGDRWKSPALLAADEEGKLLRAGVAYSLADDDAGLTRLRSRYQGFIDASRNPEALRVALAGVGGGLIGRADFSRTTADTQTFAGWVNRMKQRFREKPSPSSATQQAAAPAAKG